MIFTASKEVNVDSTNNYFYIPYKVYFLDTVSTDSLQMAVELPKFSEVSCENPYFTGVASLVEPIKTHFFSHNQKHMGFSHFLFSFDLPT